jgi:IS5 family transposase
MASNASNIQRRRMGREEVSRPHSIRYIRQLMEWGFDKEFIARDAGINVESLMTRLRRAEERERKNGNQGTESGTSSD